MLYEFVDSNKYSIIDINRARSKKDSRFDTEGGIPDILIVTPDFVYEDETAGKLLAVIEVKHYDSSKLAKETKQMLGQKKKTKHYVVTNGLKRIFYE